MTLTTSSQPLRLTLDGAQHIDLHSTLAPLRRGPYDPTFATDRSGAVWRAMTLDSGVATMRVRPLHGGHIDAALWGPGAVELAPMLPGLLGLEDDPAALQPEHPVLRHAVATNRGMRLTRTGRVFESLVPAVIEQRVQSVAAYRSYRALIGRFGTPAPGPVPTGLTAAPAAQVWRTVPSWEFHRANVDPGRARTIVRAAAVADSLERLTELEPEDARTRMQSLAGIGPWTAAETAQRAFGDPDAVSVGDYNLPRQIGWAFARRPMDDAEMLEALEPVRGQRHRAVRLLLASGQADAPRHGPRTPLTDHRFH